jgi:DUF1009 family protein
LSLSLGIIAGNREFPLWLARSARQEGVGRLVSVGFKGITSPKLAKLVDEMIWLGLGQIGHLKEVFRSRGIQELVMVGQIPHRLAWRALKFDAEGLQFFRSLKEKNAKTILGGLIQAFENDGFKFIDSTRYLKNQMAEEKVLTHRSPNAEEWEDMTAAVRAAQALADLEIGQTVIIKKGIIVAVEGVEGTDACISRAGKLAGKGCIVLKAARTRQDMRYDVPVVGLDTLKVLRKAKCSVLGIEKSKTLILDKEVFIREADALGLSVVGVDLEKLKQN